MSLQPTCAAAFSRQRGFSLIEVIAAVVVIAIGAAILASFHTPAAGSADPMIQAQARSIAGAYMEEILLRDWGEESGICTGGSRPTWETIWCYDGLDEAPRDQFGNTLGGLSDYRVQVTVGDQGSTASVLVEVSHDRGDVNLQLQGKRGNY